MALTKSDWAELRNIFNEDINFGDGNGPTWSVTFGDPNNYMGSYEISFSFSTRDDDYVIATHYGRTASSIIVSGRLSNANIHLIRVSIDNAAAEIWDSLTERYEILKRIGSSIEKFRNKIG